MIYAVFEDLHPNGLPVATESIMNSTRTVMANKVYPEFVPSQSWANPSFSYLNAGYVTPKQTTLPVSSTIITIPPYQNTYTIERVGDVPGTVTEYRYARWDPNVP